MSWIRHLGGTARAIAVAVALALGGPTAALADQCDLSDAGQAIKDIGSSDFWTKCSSETDDDAFWALFIYLSAVDIGQDVQTTGGTSTTPQNLVTTFCQTALADINSATSKTVQDAVDDAPDSIKQGLSDALNNVLGDDATTDLASVGSDFICACQAVTMKGVAQLGDVIGDCSQAIACQLSGNTLGCCPQSPTPPIHIDCSLQSCQTVTFQDPGQPPVPCTNGPSLVSQGILEAPDACGDYHHESPYCVGDLCYSQDPTQPPNGNPTYVCACPAPMQYQYMPDTPGGYIQCLCPPGSTAQNGQCVCPDGSTTGWHGANAGDFCPPKPKPPVCAPTCAGGQKPVFTDQANCKYTCQCPDNQVEAAGSCVTPCGAGQVMLEGGTCCAASQVNNCGVCCPEGMKPDATGATCVSRALAAPPLLTPKPPKPGQSLKPNSLGKP